MQTIFALSSGKGAAGVAVIRISGPDALKILEIFAGNKRVRPHGLLHRVSLCAPQDGELLDNAMAVYFKAPKSFTGEDVVELHTHGTPVTVRAILRTLGAIENLREAEAGEFTKIALSNGKIDLLEVEGLSDLLVAKTERQRKQALRQSQQAKQFESWRKQLLDAQAYLSALIDFPDEELDSHEGKQIIIRIDTLIQNLNEEVERFLKHRQVAATVRDGIEILIAGAPNVGKSTILNVLCGHEAAIVSEEAGTTRDPIRIELEIAGIPVFITDTAGLRDKPSSQIEAEGIRRSEALMLSADLLLWVYDLREGPGIVPNFDGEILLLGNKSDLGGKAKEGLSLVANKGEGIEALVTVLEQKIATRAPHVDMLLPRERHAKILAEVQEALQLGMTQPLIELKAESLRNASTAIGRLVGKIDIEEVLDQLFNEFCIGK